MPTPSLFSSVKSCQPIYSCRPCLFRVPLGKCPSPTLWPSMQHISHCYKPTPIHTRCGGSPFLPSLAGLVIYSLHGEVLLPLSPGAPPSLLCVFFQLLVYYSLFNFVHFVGQWSVCPGGYADLSQEWLWGYHVPLICSPVGLHLPSRLGAGTWWHGNPLGFLVYHDVGKLCEGWGCGCVRVLPLLGGFSCQVCLEHLSKIFNLTNTR
jgi:hypothetical protein